MRFVLVACAAAAAWGQTARTIQLTQSQTRSELEQIAVVLRAIADLAPLSVDDAKRTMTVAGTPAQIDMAEWLARQLDRRVQGQTPAVQEYRPPDGGDDLVQVFYATHASTPQTLQEIATTIRSLTDIRRLQAFKTRM